MRWFVWGAAGIAVVAFLQALTLLLDPAPHRSDLVGFSLFSLGLIFAFLAVALSTRPRWWTWWLPAAWIGSALGTLTLAYKDTFLLELSYFGPFSLAWQMFLHVLIAPIEIFFGAVVGFEEPRAPLYILASLVVALLGAELLRRRLWPRERGSASSKPTRS